MQRLLALFAGLSVWSILAFSQAVPALAQTSPEITNGLCAGVNLDINATNCKNDTGEANAKITRLIHTIINLLSLVVGVVAVIMIIVGGLRYITSGGSDTSVTGAKNTILYAVIGLIIVALAQIIVRFVLNKVTQ